MLRKTQRVNLKYDFQKIRSQGRKLYTEFATLYLCENQNQKNWQANVAVPQKVTKIKPVRNRIKRLILNSLKQTTKPTPITLQIIVLTHKDISTWSQTQVNQAINHALQPLSP